jgi:hypothetical protein
MKQTHALKPQTEGRPVSSTQDKMDLLLKFSVQQGNGEIHSPGKQRQFISKHVVKINVYISTD